MVPGCFLYRVTSPESELVTSPPQGKDEIFIVIEEEAIADFTFFTFLYSSLANCSPRLVESWPRAEEEEGKLETNEEVN